MAPALLTSIDCTNQVHLIVGCNSLAGARCTKSLEVGAKPKLICSDIIHYALQQKVDSGETEWIKSYFKDEYLTTLGRQDVDNVVDAVFVTSSQEPLRAHISNLCRRLRIPVNVVDSPSLSTFTLLSTHTDGSLQIGITTSGKGCKLASRIKREVVASLPPHLGAAVGRLGELRKKLREEDDRTKHATEDDLEEDEDSDQSATFNALVLPEDVEAARTRRMRWIAQICEYWPLKRLASITDSDIQTILDSYRTPQLGLPYNDLDARIATRSQPRIILAGSGPGHPQLLTIATLNAIKSADVILADKLVPAAVLDLIPRRTPVHIARKFPGNAEAAQDELLEMGLAALKDNKTVLRLKQGDPYLFGRGGEELKWFREKGYEALVLPGITSALSAPLFANIPVTMRDVSDQVLICTGTGRKGATPTMPGYKESRTLVLLMALHRLSDIIQALTTTTETQQDSHRNLWPIDTPCTIIERASCRDQRLIRSTLKYVVSAVEELGSRPPGLLVVGRASSALSKQGNGGRWQVEEGFHGLESLDDVLPAAMAS